MNADTNVAPLNPFPTIPGNFSTSMNTAAFIPVVFLIAFVIWLLYTLVAGYHWFRYGHQSWLAVPALALHIFVSGFLMLYMMSGLR
ncbi:MAG: hypothetical protein ABIT47_04395 [Candidatus Paceibacterota bacterium]